MKYIIRLFLTLSVFIFIFLFFGVPSVRASCSDDECNRDSDCGDPDFTCSFSCCVLNGSGGTGGGGGAYLFYDCPAGTHPNFSDTANSAYICSNLVVGTATQSVGCCAYFPDGECKRTLHQVAPCVSDCTATAPTAVTYDTSSQTLSWTAGTGGVSQRLYVSEDSNQVANNCTLITSPGCIVNNTSASSPYSLSGVVSPGTVYYAKVVNYASASCSTSSATKTFLSSCNMASASLNVTLAQTATFNLSVGANSNITNTTFSSSDPAKATATSPDASYVYSTDITGVAPGPSTLTSNVYFGAELACTSDTGINVLSPDPWWQVVDSDVSAMGDLTNVVPPPNFFGLPGGGGYPGVSTYSSSTNLDSTNASEVGWIANSPVGNPKTYDYAYFANQVPADILSTKLNLLPSNVIEGTDLSAGGTQDAEGYYWYKYDGALTGLDLTLNSLASLGSRKVILLVDNADFNINAPINLTDGSGFFLVIVKGNIIVDPALTGGSPDLEGMYLADGTFDTGVSASQFNGRGSVVAYGGLLLNRDLGDVANAVTPAEVFEYAPDQILLFPRVLSTRKISWKEVAP